MFLFLCVCLSRNIETSLTCLKFLGIKLSCHSFDEGPRGPQSGSAPPASLFQLCHQITKGVHCFML